MWPRGFRTTVSDLMGATPFGATQVFDIHVAFHAGCGPPPQGTDQMCRHHSKRNADSRVLGDLRNDRENTWPMTALVIPFKRY